MNRVPIDAQATDEREQQAVSSPVDDLTSIAPLILDLELRDKVLARYDGPRRLVAEEALQFAGQLMQVTDWSGGQLLRNLGCRLTVAQLSDVDIARLERCQQLFRFISRLTGLVDILADRRAIVIECASLLMDGTCRDAIELADVMQGTLQKGSTSTAPGVELTPIDYIRLGEVTAAADLAREITTHGEGANTLQGPFDSVPASHLSTSRICVYIGSRRAELGAEVSLRIDAHLDECKVCAEAVEYCRSEAAH